jgi:hypothetical protein
LEDKTNTPALDKDRLTPLCRVEKIGEALANLRACIQEVNPP